MNATCRPIEDYNRYFLAPVTELREWLRKAGEDLPAAVDAMNDEEVRVAYLRRVLASFDRHRSESLASAFRAARTAAAVLIAMAEKPGPLAGNKFRGEVTSRAKWLMRAIDKAEGVGPPDVDFDADPTQEEQAEIETAILAAKAAKANPGKRA